MSETLDTPRYPSPPPSNNAPATTDRSVRAIDLLAFIFALIGLSIVGLALGIIGFVLARKHHRPQHALGTVGIVLGALGCVGWTVLMLVGAFASGVSDGFQHGMSSDSTVSDDQAAPSVDPIKISATKMGDDFERNQIAAEKKWGGKYVQFTAQVTNINGEGVAFANVTSDITLTQIDCHVQDTSTMLKLQKYHAATVRGTVDPDQVVGVISLDKCEVVNP